MCVGSGHYAKVTRGYDDGVQDAGMAFGVVTDVRVGHRRLLRDVMLGGGAHNARPVAVPVLLRT